MWRLADAPRVRAIEAKGHDALTGFSCGTEYEWERELNCTVRKLAASGGPADTRTYLVEDRSPGARNAFIGVAAFFQWWPGIHHKDLHTSAGGHAMYIQALGITAGYRKSRVPRGAELQGVVPEVEGEVPIGAWLLAWTLQEIRSQWPGEEGCPVSALVHKENERCHRMLDAQDFVRDETGGQFEMWIRAQHVNPKSASAAVIERD
jgi:hypothetical protein